MKIPNDKFAIFILTHGRSDRVFTYNTLRKQGYTGKIFLIIDDRDKEQEKYKKKFGERSVVIFSKDKIKGTFDIMDNFEEDNVVVFARNACFDIAEELGLDYFVMLDDDYEKFEYIYKTGVGAKRKSIKDLNTVFSIMVEFLENTKIKSVAMAQAGDFVGGLDNGFLDSPMRIRKCMNSFVCATKRRFQFIGRINEDVNTYIRRAGLGDIFLTIPFLSLIQKQTQSNKGGLTDVYLNLGTYVKSFYSVIAQPSSVNVEFMMSKHKRLHHSVSTKSTYPMIIREKELAEIRED